MAHTTIVVGLDGSEAGARALSFAKTQAGRIENCKIALCYVIEWSPFTFQTPEENDQRHKRREEELALAHERIVDPAVKAAKAEGFDVTGIVQHGDVADILERVAVEHDAAQIVIGRIGARGLRERLFGGVSGRLVATATVPVTIIP
ncbi:universal stress protein [Sulfitobacter sabulilitoris]|uniref:Universal stress protein n=1 Tax=Sulfitobacter sabulilitoris TaxID=2562655 RepID=A0A5S3PBS9_9RHOB|nr:universal stress protein [Sulfitobacter sabulilitoris]TMM51156.1 universal stress protein [Sulfitobacter sabulilitoris]